MKALTCIYANVYVYMYTYTYNIYYYLSLFFCCCNKILETVDFIGIAKVALVSGGWKV